MFFDYIICIINLEYNCLIMNILFKDLKENIVYMLLKVHRKRQYEFVSVDLSTQHTLVLSKTVLSQKIMRKEFKRIVQ